jgi:Icc-related predicted phosphoesterase
MKLWIISDLHLEFAAWLPDVPDADVCVVAGDVINKGPERAIDWLTDHVAWAMPVVCVAGNHEYYGSIWGYDYSLARALENTRRTHFLENETVVIGGTRFVGATLWTDFELNGGSADEVAWTMHTVGSQLNDYRMIGDFNEPSGRITPQRTKAIHETSRAFLDHTLATPFAGATVVVTHHAPHPGSIGQQFQGSALNAGFASDLSGLIERRRPNLWIHGHMHNSADYWAGTTRIVCNPRGYGNENRGFDPALVVEV